MNLLRNDLPAKHAGRSLELIPYEETFVSNKWMSISINGGGIMLMLDCIPLAGGVPT